MTIFMLPESFLRGIIKCNMLQCAVLWLNYQKLFGHTVCRE